MSRKLVGDRGSISSLISSFSGTPREFTGSCSVAAGVCVIVLRSFFRTIWLERYTHKLFKLLSHTNGHEIDI